MHANEEGSDNILLTGVCHRVHWWPPDHTRHSETSLRCRHRPRRMTSEDLCSPPDERMCQKKKWHRSKMLLQCQKTSTMNIANPITQLIWKTGKQNLQLTLSLRLGSAPTDSRYFTVGRCLCSAAQITGVQPPSSCKYPHHLHLKNLLHPLLACNRRLTWYHHPYYHSDSIHPLYGCQILSTMQSQRLTTPQAPVAAVTWPWPFSLLYTTTTPPTHSDIHSNFLTLDDKFNGVNFSSLRR